MSQTQLVVLARLSIESSIAKQIVVKFCE